MDEPDSAPFRGPSLGQLGVENPKRGEAALVFASMHCLRTASIDVHTSTVVSVKTAGPSTVIVSSGPKGKRNTGSLLRRGSVT